MEYVEPFAVGCEENQGDRINSIKPGKPFSLLDIFVRYNECDAALIFIPDRAHRVHVFLAGDAKGVFKQDHDIVAFPDQGNVLRKTARQN